MKRAMICKHCRRRIVKDTAGRGWRHGDTGPYQCSNTYATPRKRAKVKEGKS